MRSEIKIIKRKWYYTLGLLVVGDALHYKISTYVHTYKYVMYNMYVCIRKTVKQKYILILKIFLQNVLS